MYRFFLSLCFCPFCLCFVFVFPTNLLVFIWLCLSYPLLVGVPGIPHVKFRSASLRLGGMFVSPLESHFSPAKTALADRLQWARSSIRKKLDMGSQHDTASESTVLKENEKEEKMDVKPQEMVQESGQSTWNRDVNHVDQEDRASNSHLPSDEVAKIIQNSQPTVKTVPTCSPERHTLTHGDPLGALDIINEVARSTPVSAEISRLKPFVLPDPSVRLFTSSHSTSSSGSSTEDDSSEDDSSEESESEEESDHSHDVSSSASRLSFR